MRDMKDIEQIMEDLRINAQRVSTLAEKKLNLRVKVQHLETELAAVQASATRYWRVWLLGGWGVGIIATILIFAV